MAMKKSSITRIAALGAGLLAIALPAAALAQDEPTAPESRTSEGQTGSRLQTITGTGARRGHPPPAPRRADAQGARPAAAQGAGLRAAPLPPPPTLRGVVAGGPREAR